MSGIDQPDEDFVLLGSGATHALRLARGAEEWQNAMPTSVHLADGVTEMFRLKRRTKILLRPTSFPREVCPSSTSHWSGVEAFATSKMMLAEGSQ